MNRLTQSMVMVVVGVVLLRISMTDVHLRYVKTSMTGYLVATGIFLILIGIVTFLYDVKMATPGGKHRARSAQPICCVTDEQGKQEEGPRSAWMLLLPVVAIVLIAPQPLGSYAATRSGTAAVIAKPKNTDPSVKSVYPPLPSKDPVTLPLLDYAARAAFEKGISLEGRQVQLVGFISPREGGAGVYLTRMIMVCCAADSRPIKVGLTGTLGTLKPDQWVRVVGVYDSRLDTDSTNGEKIPYIRVQSIKKIAPPDNPFDG